MARKLKFGAAASLLLMLLLPGPGPQAIAVPNPVATDEATYQAYGRVFPDPQGCEAFGVPDTDNDGVKNTPFGVSPYAKGRVCVGQFISYEEAVEGTRFLARRFPRFLQVIRLDQAYDNPDFMSAGLPKTVAVEDGKVRVLGRDRRPLYLFKVTDAQSPVPERERLHFAYGLSIHGIERAGVEGGLRAMEDLVTWAACETGSGGGVVPPPGCAAEGPFPKRIVETPTSQPVPTAGDTLRGSVTYFMLANPDGWARGQFAPAEVEDGSPNLNYTPGGFFQRYNGNGVDLNRDWPTVGYTYRPYSPGSEPETRAFAAALQGIRNATAAGRFAGGIDLHGQLTANAYSFTLLGSGQRDFRKNFSTVDQSLRAWRDQTARLAWSPYIAGPGRPGVFSVADQWGTVVDTLGYQVSGALGDWFDSPLGLDAVGIDNEMSLSHLAPNSVFDPINEQMHVDGNKGLIYSQIASMLTEQDYVYEPRARIGYVFNPVTVSHDGRQRPSNPGLPAQNDIEVLVPCQGAAAQNLEGACGDARFVLDGAAPTLEFDVLGPDRGVFNGGITAVWHSANAGGVGAGSVGNVQLQRFEEGAWQNVATSFVQGRLVSSGGQPIGPDAYLQAGQVVTADDPVPGRWRVRYTNASGVPARVRIDFNRTGAEADPGQAAFSASSMDFFDDLNRYVRDPARRLEPVPVGEVVNRPGSLDRFDSLVVVNKVGTRSFLTQTLGLSEDEATRYFEGLRGFAARGGNLMLTDEALTAVGEFGIAAPVGSNQPAGRGAVPRYQLSFTGRPNLCTPTSPDPLLRDVCLPGTAGGTQRQAVEPTPLGYVPDTTLDPDPAARLRQWFITRANWQDGCGKTDVNQCTSGLLNGQAGLGERHLGDGRIRIAGAMFPDPLFLPNTTRDMRFGVASYALTFSAWQMFLNLVDYQRPAAPPPPEADLSVLATDVPDPVVVGDALTYTIAIFNGGPDTATEVTLTNTLPDTVVVESAPEGCERSASTLTCPVGSIAADAVATVTLTVRPQQPGDIVNVVRVSAGEDDPVEANNETRAVTTVVCTITGTAGNDVLRGTPARDVICGLAGNDDVRGLDGGDLLLGGAGADLVHGNAGADDVRGNDGNDDLRGGDGDDRLDGGAGSDRINGGPGVDACARDESDAAVVECE